MGTGAKGEHTCACAAEPCPVWAGIHSPAPWPCPSFSWSLPMCRKDSCWDFHSLGEGVRTISFPFPRKYCSDVVRNIYTSLYELKSSLQLNACPHWVLHALYVFSIFSLVSEHSTEDWACTAPSHCSRALQSSRRSPWLKMKNLHFSPGAAINQPAKGGCSPRHSRGQAPPSWWPGTWPPGRTHFWFENRLFKIPSHKTSNWKKITYGCPYIYFIHPTVNKGWVPLRSAGQPGSFLSSPLWEEGFLRLWGTQQETPTLGPTLGFHGHLSILQALTSFIKDQSVWKKDRKSVV